MTEGTRSAAEVSPLSRLFLVDTLRDTDDLSIETSAAEREALAALDGIKAIHALSATLHLDRGKDGVVRVSGTLKARVVQVCVVSLEPFETTVEEPIAIGFASPSVVRAAEKRVAEAIAGGHDPAALPEPPDPIEDGRIDLGAVVAEFLALGLDPYPRKPGVVFEAEAAQDAPKESPFAGLARLKTPPD